MFNKNHFSPLFISILLTILGIGIVIFKMLEGTLTLMSGITLEILLVLILGAQLSHHKMQIRRLQEEQPQRRFQFSPLDGSFMGISMVGLLVSLMYIYQESRTRL